MDELISELEDAYLIADQLREELGDAYLIADQLREELEGVHAQCDDLQAIIDARDALLRRALAVLASVPAALLAEQGEAYLPEHIKEALK